MVPVQFYPGSDFEAGDSGSPADAPRAHARDASEPGGRLNLLLSFGGWEPDPWIDRLPAMLEPMGVQSLQAGSGREAGELIERHPIHLAVVDLDLPLDAPAAPGGEGSSVARGGARLLEILRRLSQPPPTVVVKHRRTHRDDAREMAAALRAGAFAVIDRPREPRDLEVMLEVMRRCLARHYKGRWPGVG